MEIQINDARTIRGIQREFSREFPFLKIEFYDTLHSVERPSPKHKMLAPEMVLGNCRKVHEEGALHVVPDNTIAQLENELWENFGLSGKIFRLSGKIWIDTQLTHNWTLEQQNREGRHASERYRNPYRESEDDIIADPVKWE